MMQDIRAKLQEKLAIVPHDLFSSCLYPYKARMSRSIKSLMSCKYGRKLAAFIELFRSKLACHSPAFTGECQQWMAKQSRQPGPRGALRNTLLAGDLILPSTAWKEQEDLIGEVVIYFISFQLL